MNMEINTSAKETVDSLKKIFDKHKNDRICIMATTCCGKSTLHELIPETVDMDDELWPQLTEEEEAHLCQKPWTKEIGDFAGRLVRERVTVKPGHPLFTLILLDCEVLVYLDISDELLAEHCKKRQADFQDAKNINDAIKNTWNRLFRNNSHKIEWLTSMHYLKKFIKEGAFLLDGCAGTGNYAFPLAESGYEVIAGDIVPGNIDIIREKQKNSPVLKDIYVGNMLDLSRFSDENFDAVLCMGAFYHVDDEIRSGIMKECLRVLKPGGLLVISYINTMAGVIVGLDDKLNNMDQADKWFENRTTDGVFLYMTPYEIEKMALSFHMEIVCHLAVDGINYLLSDKINAADEENFNKWYQFHLKTCEDKSLLGYSLHSMIILRK